MKLAKQHIISKRDPRYSISNEAAFTSKNLYNAALYLVRQSYIHEWRYLNYNEVQRRMQSHEASRAVPAKATQHILRFLQQEFPVLERKLPTLWTMNYFVSTVGGALPSVTKHYIEKQKHV